MRLLLLLLLPFASIGQITVQEPDMCDGGDTAWISTTMDPSIDFSTTGPNQFWDYSYLTPNSQELVEYYDINDASFAALALFGFFAPQEYKATNFRESTQIPLAQISAILPVSITDVFAFSKNSPDSITSVGFSMMIEGFELPFKSDTIETRYKFPMNYGDSFYSKGYTNLDMNPIYNGVWRQYRERTSNVDGWGTITTPYGTFDALRIDHFIQETDSIYMEIFGFGTWIELPIPDSHIYEWWTNGQKEPILRITTSDIFGTETVNNIEYRDFLYSSGISELTNEIRIYPNPSSEQISIEGVEINSPYKIYSITGDCVKSGELNGTIDVSNLNTGIYSIVFNGIGNSLTHTFIKN